jgi:hypothetical protein
VPNLVSSLAPLTFLTNMGDRPQSTAASAIQVKNQQQAVCIEEKLDIINQLEKGEEIVDLCLNGRFTVAYTQFMKMLIEVLIQ